MFIPGPATEHSKRKEILDPYQPFGSFYLEGNVFILEDGTKKEAGLRHIAVSEAESDVLLETQPFPFQDFSHVRSPEVALDMVLRHAGASLCRDPVDQRIVLEIQNGLFTYGTKGIINSQDETGGWPELRSQAALADSDGDGIPDEWEIRNGLDPNKHSDGNAFTLHPYYTNIEIYLNELVKDTFPTSDK